jgi:hypothetical protein
MTNLQIPADRAPAHCAFYRAVEAYARAGDLLSNEALENALDNFPSTKAEMEAITSEGRPLTYDELAARLQMPADFVELLFASFVTGVPLGVRAATVH